MYDLRPAPKRRNVLLPILLALVAIVSIPFVYALLLIAGAFLKGFLGW